MFGCHQLTSTHNGPEAVSARVVSILTQARKRAYVPADNKLAELLKRGQCFLKGGHASMLTTQNTGSINLHLVDKKLR